MSNRNDLLFTLTPQRDRRQLPDRRIEWRGSRRAADYAYAKASPADRSLVLWPSMFDQVGAVIDKRVVHGNKPA